MRFIALKPFQIAKGDGRVTMTIPTQDQIRSAAAEFKSALDSIDRAHWEAVYIESFPRGACGHCAELLALYLQRQLGITPDYVCKTFYGPDGTRDTSHAWLEWNGLIIDISGDQFGWPPVIVTRVSPLHGRGEDEQRHRWKLDPSWWGQQCGGIWRAAEQVLSGEK